MAPEEARTPGENYLGSRHHKLEGPVEEPEIGKTLNAIGWLAIAVSVVVSVFAVSGYVNRDAKFDVSWSIVIGGLFGGMMLLAVAAILRGLARIEQAIRETRR
jgi:uncharacterized membrane protein (DUF441 family)